ncbi:hypothetical protein AWC05_23630 [Mycobacterium florentinum]|uniref:Uncharacterized protein n=1 Tax=Mycobacterium florentinum TaxID=292462 RepID=A0A1X1U765_MYCFL|nr:hypothetical protein [Mycobacterium florentinum]MCV7409865.1 hypothetical protein [Mycobacterium florentinum]ORV52479.1 hypothetical protein AWC05_23630 [Mycobacterium florentinum]BBX79165.1 hypothetical protein MFLOJ_29520 [Mycobacterium florentinum]
MAAHTCAADSCVDAAASFCVAAQAGGSGNGRGLRRRVASQPTFTAQRAAGACPADAETSAASRGGTALTTDADTPERAGHVRSGGTVQRCALASDQPRLTAGPQRRVTSPAGNRAGVARTCQLAAGTETCLARQSGLTAQTCLLTGTEAAADLATNASTKAAGHLAAKAACRLATGTGASAERATSLAAKTTCSLAAEAATRLAAGTETCLAHQSGLTADTCLASQPGLTASTEAATGLTAGFTP